MAGKFIKEYLLNIEKNKMKTILKTNITVKDICEGFVYNELEGKGLVWFVWQTHYSAGVSAQLYLCSTAEKRNWLSLNQSSKDIR